MRIVAISDTHGYLPNIPPCDIFIHAGDICPIYDHSHNFQKIWIHDNFWPWLCKSGASHVVFIGGNHDFALADDPSIGNSLCSPMYWPRTHYLNDSEAIIDGIKIYGTPWTPTFGPWAFMESESKLAERWSSINRADIIISHGPPRGFGDIVSPRTKEDFPIVEHVGSEAMREVIERVQPKLFICGHIHSGFGKYALGGTTIYNVAYLNDQYKPQNKPVKINYDNNVFSQ